MWQANTASLEPSGKEITLNWTIELDGTNSDASKDAAEAIDFKLPDFDGATSYTANLVFSPRTGSGTAASTSLIIGTSDIDFVEADLTFEDTEYFKLSLSETDGNAAVGNNNGATDEHYFGIKNIDIINVDTYELKNNFFSSRRSLHNNYNDYGRNITTIMIK